MRAQLITAGAVVLSALVCTAMAVLSLERRTIAVTVVDKSGNLVEGLTAANFRADFHGAAVEIESAKLADSPQQVVIFLDGSGSMRRRSWKRALKILGGFTDPPMSNIELGLVVFAERSHTVVRPGGQAEPMAEVLAALPKPSSKEARAAWGFKSHTQKVLQDWLLEEPEGSLDTLVLITDGRLKERVRFDPVVRDILVARGIRFFVVHLDRGIASHVFQGWGSTSRGSFSLDPLDRTISRRDSLSRDFRFLKRLTDATGGAILLTTDPPKHTELKPAKDFAAEIQEHLRAHYVLDVNTLEPIDKRRKWKLEVVDENGKKMKGVKVHYPRYLVPLEGPQPE